MSSEDSSAFVAPARLEAFSDGVLAIVITLLVLEIKVPHLENPLSGQEAWKALLVRRTFARVQATTKDRLNLCLRLEGQQAAGRLRPSKFQENMRIEIQLTTSDEVDSEVLGWLQKACEQNR
jgi:Endosomal/lysosomal potassium channel TMEM175